MSEQIHRYAMWQKHAADPYELATPASRPSDTVLLDYAAACYDSAELDHPDCVVIRIALPPNARVTGDLRADLTAARRASQDR